MTTTLGGSDIATVYSQNAKATVFGPKPGDPERVTGR